jgi:alpha-1,3-mannosyltransferase
MNVILYAPPLLLFDDEGNEYKGSTFCLVCCSISLVSIWISISYPFEYISKSFDLGRVFIHFWSVNVKFVPELVFTSKLFSIALRATHLLLLFFFAQKRWCGHEGGILLAVGLQ